MYNDNSQIPAKHIIPQVKQLMLKMGLTQSELALKTKLTQPTISRILSAKIDFVRYITVKLLADALDTDVSELILESNSATKYTSARHEQLKSPSYGSIVIKPEEIDLSLRLKENKSWEWLDTEYSRYLKKIRDKVENLYSEEKSIQQSMPFFTPHGVEHYTAVEKLIFKLIPGGHSKVFTMSERFILLASAALHDIGEITSIVNELYPKGDIDSNEVRDNHHIIARKYILNKWYALGIEESEKEVFAQICFFHRKKEDINQCDEWCKTRFGPIRLRLMAAYLRLADALSISVSQSPSETYSIFLAYDIPLEYKLQWIKSKLINTIKTETDSSTIVVEFLIPNLNDDIHQDQDMSLVKRKMDSIERLVLEDLRTQLLSVVNVIARPGAIPYLEITSKNVEVFLDSQMQNDLRELIVNYDIMTDPSASKLLELILISVANIMGYSLSQNGEFTNIADDSNGEGEIYKKLDNFIKTLYDGPIKSRPCHIGLRKIVNKLSEARRNNDSIKSMIGYVNDAFKEHHYIRKNVRFNSEKLFENISSAPENEPINILLYGYSELVSKSLCGIRDYLIKKKHNIDPALVYNSDIEAEVSKSMNIFICEEQPKTQTNTGDHLIYHDGSLYALHLHKRNFQNIIMIPDIISGNIIEDQSLPIHYIIVGANGITDKYFRHSAGHSAIVNLAREYRDRVGNNICQTKIVLVVSSEKYLPESPDMPGSDLKKPLNNQIFENVKADDPLLVEGARFLMRSNISMRQSIWLMKDKELLDKLYNSGILFYNPREDIIPIKHIDYIISDIRYDQITNESSENIIRTHFSATYDNEMK